MLTIRNVPQTCRPRSVSSFPSLDSVLEQFVSPSMASLFHGQAAGFPALNAWQDDKAIYIEAELPGFDASGLDISVTGDELVIRGSRERSEPESAQVIRRERWSGTFERTVKLPLPVDSEKVSATFVNGILTLTLPKPVEVQPKKIRVTAG